MAMICLRANWKVYMTCNHSVLKLKDFLGSQASHTL